MTRDGPFRLRDREVGCEVEELLSLQRDHLGVVAAVSKSRWAELCGVRESREVDGLVERAVSVRC